MAEDKWQAIRAGWENGEDEKALADRHGTKCKTIRATAQLEGWDASKRQPKAIPKPPTRAHAPTHAREALAEGGDATGTVNPPEGQYNDPMPEDPVQLLAQHEGDWQKLRNHSMTLLQGCTSPRLLAAIAGAIKLYTEGQRRSKGLDKKADDDKPPEQEHKPMLIVPADTPDWQRLMGPKADDERRTETDP